MNFEHVHYARTYLEQRIIKQNAKENLIVKVVIIFKKIQIITFIK